MSDDCFAYEISGLMALKDWDCLVSETSFDIFNTLAFISA